MIKIIQKIWRKMPHNEIRRRLQLANTYKKENFKLKDEKEVFDKIYTDNFWSAGQSESVSGRGGSTLSGTVKIRKILPVLWKKYNVKTFLDVPCGDFNWMKEVDKKNIVYIGGDIVKSVIDENIKKYQQENVTFEVLDITKDTLPKVDMILCRDCLQHLSYENVKKALINFKQSGSKYLFVTTFPLTKKNWDILDGDYRPLNLRKVPFNLPKPIKKMHERITNCSAIDTYLFLYELDTIYSDT